MPTDRSICLIHLPRSVVDELFLVHDHQVSMQQRGIALYSRDESMQKAWNESRIRPLSGSANGPRIQSCSSTAAEFASGITADPGHICSISTTLVIFASPIFQVCILSIPSLKLSCCRLNSVMTAPGEHQLTEPFCESTTRIR